MGGGRLAVARQTWRFWSQAKRALQLHEDIDIPEVFRMVVGNEEVKGEATEGTMCSAAEGIAPAPSPRPTGVVGMRVEACPPLATTSEGGSLPPPPRSPRGRRLASPSLRANHIPLFRSWANTTNASAKEG